jgi:hypothetical protein
MLTAQLATIAALAEEEGDVNQLLSFGIGGLALGILVAMLVVLITIGGGREHS